MVPPLTGKLINEDGAKRFLKGGRVRSCYFGMCVPAGALFIVEGYATGATVHEATGHAVAVAFDAGNLPNVATGLRATYPDLSIVLCADNDTHSPGNPGMTKAIEAARRVNGWLTVPQFGWSSSRRRPTSTTSADSKALRPPLHDSASSPVSEARRHSDWPQPRPSEEGSTHAPLGNRLRQMRPTGSVGNVGLLGYLAAERYHVSGPQRVEIVTPAGHHRCSLVAELRPVVGTPVHVPHVMVQLRLDPLDALA